MPDARQRRQPDWRRFGGADTLGSAQRWLRQRRRGSGFAARRQYNEPAIQRDKTYADRKLERELAQGPPAPGARLAGATPAGRAVPAGAQARGREFPPGRAAG